MPIPLVLKCNAEQASHYSASRKMAFGYINALTVHEYPLTADLTVAEPLSDVRVPYGLAGGVATRRKQIRRLFTKSVVGILNSFTWANGRASDDLVLDFLVSAKNAAKLEMFFRQQEPAQDLPAEFALVVYAWDYLKDCYFVRFCTHLGSGSAESEGGENHPDSRATGKSLTATLKSGSVEDEPVDDPQSQLGAILFHVNLTLIATATKQQFRIATSQDAKDYLSWGEAQDGEAPDVFEMEDGPAGKPVAE